MIHRVHLSDRAETVPVPAGHGLAEHLSVRNSPVLFGCRTGICGTCLSRIEGEALPPDAGEREMLDIYAPGLPDARLLCQVRLTGDVTVLAYLGGGG